MIVQNNSPTNFNQKAKEIRGQAISVLETWGLVPRFKRWRLSQDSETGMIVLFGVLNNQYIARHTLIPLNHYFDTQLLHDLANKLQVQVISGKNGGLGYAFILSRGQINLLPAKIDFSFPDENRLYPIFIWDRPEHEIVQRRTRLSRPDVGSIIDYDET